jgi:hypothetical protein
MCECGRSATVSGSSLRESTTRSCGCLRSKPPIIQIDLSGQRFGMLVVIQRGEPTRGGKVRWLCQCDCGRQKLASSAYLRHAKSKSCGCTKRIPSRLNNLRDKRFGKLVAIERPTNGAGKGVRWLCRCDCGGTVTTLSSSLISGKTQSCGCIKSGVWDSDPGELGFRELLGKYRRNAQVRGLPFELTTAEFRALTQAPCSYCGAPPAKIQPSSSKRPNGLAHGSYTYSGVDRIDSSRGYVAGNVVSCCTTCNLAKNEMPRDDFILLIRRIYQHSIAIRRMAN